MTAKNTMGGARPRNEGDAKGHWSDAAMARRRGRSVDLFWSRVTKSEGCWLWTAGVHEATGYGYFGKPKKLTHRLSWELTNGTIPDELCVLHKCDVRRCVRPDHLFLGTRPENSADMVAKGRQPRFVGAKLNMAAAAEIRKKRANGATIPDLQRQFGVSKATIRSLLSGRTWQ